MPEPTLEDRDFEYVCSLIRTESGMALQAGKRYLVESRLRAVARGEGIADLTTLVREARAPAAADLRDRIVQGVLVGETQFFRDEHPFETLREHILPDILASRGAERALSVWCAASSSGQEPYSVAMLLAEHFPRLAGWRVRILASDLSDHMLARARTGEYSAAEIGRGLPPVLRERYFTARGDRWVLSEAVRRRVEFHRINLIGEWPPLPRLDLVLLRNVLIYFDAATRRRVVERVRDVLKPGGWLFFGTSESLDLTEAGFRQVRFGRTLCYRRGEA